MRFFFSIISSRVSTYLISVVWLSTILFSWWFIAPKVDDGIYLYPAITVLHTLKPGVLLGDSIQPIFFIFPTQPFLHGIFLKILDFFSININIETYRLFNYFLVVSLFYLTHKLFKLIFHQAQYQRLALNLTLIILGLSQFSMHFYVNRPEILGLVFFMSGLIYFIKSYKADSNQKFDLFVSFLFFGFAGIVHPNLLLLSTLIIFYAFYNFFKSHSLVYFKYVLSFFLPILSLLLWFYINLDVVKDQLFNRVEEVSSNSIFNMPAVKNIFFTITADNHQSLFHNLYLQLHMLTFVVTLILLFYYFIKKENESNSGLNLSQFFKFLSFSILILIIFMSSFRPYFLLASFLSIISLAFFVTLHVSESLNIKIDQLNSKKSYLSFFICLIAFTLPLSLPIFHIGKIYVSNGSYDNHHNTLKAVRPLIEDDQEIFITTGQLLPLFSRKISTDILLFSPPYEEKIHWYFPIADSPSPQFKLLMNEDIKRDLNLMQGAIWGSLKKTVLFDDANKIACLSLKGSQNYINLYEPEIIFEDRQNIFLLSDKVVPSIQCLK
jgi:hypothetical protein